LDANALASGIVGIRRGISEHTGLRGAGHSQITDLIQAGLCSRSVKGNGHGVGEGPVSDLPARAQV
jgi:hypothetical protein